MTHKNKTSKQNIQNLKKKSKKEFDIPQSHPRYESLMLREAITDGVRNGITALEGLIAHGRGEAFDYLIGEKTIVPAQKSIRVAAAYLLLARNPVISVNGNVAALAPEAIIKLSEIIPAKIEVNIFHHSNARFAAIIKRLKETGAKGVLGETRDKLIPNLDHARAKCTSEGIYSADVVLIPLEDGDRASALRNMGKTVITIDLNPLSRTARVSNVTIVDNLVRAFPLVQNYIIEFKEFERKKLEDIVNSYDNESNLKETLRIINSRLNNLKIQSGI
jgi:4-phosphopantoate--beta-alanine ligase